jgi:hypothetical protein
MSDPANIPPKPPSAGTRIMSPLAPFSCGRPTTTACNAGASPNPPLSSPD